MSERPFCMVWVHLLVLEAMYQDEMGGWLDDHQGALKLMGDRWWRGHWYRQARTTAAEVRAERASR